MGRFVLPLAQVFTSSGRLGAGYQLSFFTTGTSTPLDTYSDAARTIANSNPVVADASGIFDDIHLADVPYKVVLTDADDVEVWSADPVQTSTGEIGIPVPLSKGGTGATSAANARVALGLGTAATYTIGDGADEVPTNSMVSGVPTGGIIMWSGSVLSVPAAWALCDGGTYSKSDGSGSISAPDLRDRFVIGAGTTYAPNATGGATSGTTSSGGGGGTVTTTAAGGHNHTGSTDGHTLTIAQMPAHNHDITQGGNYNINNVVSTNSSGSMNTAGDNTTVIKSKGGGGSHSHGIQSVADHTHDITTTDHTHTVATVPPFLALAYIMKL